MKVILIGFMASGKSTMAKLLSQKWQVANHDLDQMVEAAAGMPIPQYFQKNGETAFRNLETRTLKQALQLKGILSTGGGTPMRIENSQMIQQSKTPVIFLNASDQTIHDRLIHEGAESRPLFQKLGMAGMRQLKHQRQPTYEKLADVVVDVNNQNPRLNLDRILKQLEVIAHD